MLGFSPAQYGWPADPAYKALHQEYYCAAFNAVCAIVMRTQSQEKFYSGLLFKENPVVRVGRSWRPFGCTCLSRSSSCCLL